MKQIKVLMIASCLALFLTCSGCDKTQEPVQVDSPTKTVEAPGKITVKAGNGSFDQTKGDKFRTYDVKGQAQIKYAPEGAEVTEAVKNVQVVVASRNSNPYAGIYANLLSKRLSKEFIVLCSACHDDYGNGVIGPSLIGKTGNEVRNMIEKYSNDADANVLMADLVKRMTPEQIDFISNDLARFNAEVSQEKKAAKEVP